MEDFIFETVDTAACILRQERGEDSRSRVLQQAGGGRLRAQMELVKEPGFEAALPSFKAPCSPPPCSRATQRIPIRHHPEVGSTLFICTCLSLGEELNRGNMISAYLLIP